MGSTVTDGCTDNDCTPKVEDRRPSLHDHGSHLRSKEKFGKVIELREVKTKWGSRPKETLWCQEL